MLVSSSRGAGGGWTLSKEPADITLRDVYAAPGDRLLQGIDVTGTAARLGRITLEDIACARTKQS